MAKVSVSLTAFEQSVPFSLPVTLPESIAAVHEFLLSNPRAFSGNGVQTKACQKALSDVFGYQNPLLTSSCTSALEIAALSLKMHLGATFDHDNPPVVICPSFTFVSTTNSFAKYGFRIRYVDINPDTMNNDENAIEAALTTDVVAVVVVHYGGISCDMARIETFCKANNLFLISDAAQAIGVLCHDKPVANYGDMACLSFHDTKNCTAGEGGALLVNNEVFLSNAKIAREKGTNREQFLQGQVDKYTWVGLGGHYLMSEINATYLLPQLILYNMIHQHRMALWQRYQNRLQALEARVGYDVFKCPVVPKFNQQNAHIYHVKLRDNAARVALRDYLRTEGIESSFHYTPLHLNPYGIETGSFAGDDHNTVWATERLLRLPMYYGLKIEDVDRVCDAIERYYK
jgi:dTDP-4-amino-4,6-dideoxygalactose transaminase